MNNTIILTLCVLVMTVNAAGTVAQQSGRATTCPEPTTVSERFVASFVQSPKNVALLDRLGLSDVSAEDVEVVTNRSVCDALQQDYQDSFYDDYTIHFYRVENVYFVAVLLKPSDDPDVVRMGSSMVDIYNSSLSFVEGYSY